MTDSRKNVYINKQSSEDLQYIFERMKVFGLIPTQAADVGKYRAQVIAYALRACVEAEQQRLVDIEALEREESALETEIEHASGGHWLGEEEQGERQEVLEALQDALDGTRRKLGKL